MRQSQKALTITQNITVQDLAANRETRMRHTFVRFVSSQPRLLSTLIVRLPKLTNISARLHILLPVNSIKSFVYSLTPRSLL